MPDGNRPEPAPDRLDVPRWTRDAGEGMNARKCRGGSCDGVDDGSRCERHDRTGEVVHRYVRAKLAQRQRRVALLLAIDDRFRARPCSADDYRCSNDYTCLAHRDSGAHVARVFGRFVRLRERGIV